MRDIKKDSDWRKPFFQHFVFHPVMEMYAKLFDYKRKYERCSIIIWRLFVYLEYYMVFGLLGIPFRKTGTFKIRNQFIKRVKLRLTENYK